MLVELSYDERIYVSGGKCDCFGLKTYGYNQDKSNLGGYQGFFDNELSCGRISISKGYPDWICFSKPEPKPSVSFSGLSFVSFPFLIPFPVFIGNK